MDEKLIVAIIAGGVALIVALLANSMSFLIHRSQIQTEYNAVKLAKRLLNQKEYSWRTSSYLNRRLGGFNDDELRRILVRAGAVRFYLSFKEVYLGDLEKVILDQIDEEKKTEPVEMWGLLSRPGVKYQLLNEGNSHFDTEYGTAEHYQELMRNDGKGI